MANEEFNEFPNRLAFDRREFTVEPGPPAPTASHELSDEAEDKLKRTLPRIAVVGPSVGALTSLARQIDFPGEELTAEQVAELDPPLTDEERAAFEADAAADEAIRRPIPGDGDILLADEAGQ